MANLADVVVSNQAHSGLVSDELGDGLERLLRGCR